MNEIGLRTYLQQIVEMVQEERYEEAILHARHILRHYPKYLPVYRVLGEIYLSNRRFPEAADLFQRVLSAVPDDFLAHFGMSTIREEEGNLDAAIWHMERAFEAQPTHVAIQEELRRLYRERDGVAPPRIRFTRVALARIYLHSGLLNQSIVELQAVLQQDPRRLDALTLLAQAYHDAGQTLQAAEACQRLLQKLPYSLVANRIMAHILRGQGREDDAQQYWSRVLELDPYEAFTGAEFPTAEQVPAEKVQIPRLEMEYTGDLDALPTPDAAEMPMLEELDAVARDTGLLDEDDLGPAEDEIFALHEEAELPEEEPSSEAGSGPYVPPEQAETLIPEWMQESGWAPRDPSVPLDAAPAPPPADAGDEDEEEEAVAAGDIPEWLQALKPQQEAAPPTEAESAAEEEAAEAWLPETALRDDDQAAVDDVGMWLEAAEESGALPAWMQSETETAAPPAAEAEEGELPAWLREAAAATEAAPAQEAGAADMPLPAWLQAEEEAPEAEAEAAELPEWLSEAAAQAEAEAPAEAAPETEAAAPAAEAEMPEWLRAAAPPTEDASAPPSAENLEDGIANLLWSEAQPQRPKPQPAAEAEPPEWMLPGEEWLAASQPPAGAATPSSPTASAEAEPVPPETMEWVQEVTAAPEEEVEDIAPPAWVPTQQVPPPETMILKPLPEVADPYLEDLRQAREAIANYQLERGLRLYRRLVRRRKYLSEVIEDLLQAQYYYPMSVELLQLLGDAFARAGRLQDALDTYLKAEELLR